MQQQALKSGQLSGYAGDVWFPQPAPNDHVWRTMPNHGMTPHTSGTTLSAQARYAAGTREILECFFDKKPIRDEYLIVKDGQLAGMGAHSYTKGSATGGSEEAAKYKKQKIQKQPRLRFSTSKCADCNITVYVALALLFAIFLFYYLIMKKRKSSIKKLKPKKKQRSAVELHKVLPTLKLVEDKKQDKKEIKTISEQSQDELEPIISTPITSPMSDE